MPPITTWNKLLVTLPDDYQLDQPAGAIPILDFNSQDPLIEAVRDLGMDLLDHFVFTPAATLTRRAARAADVSVPLEVGENAVILLEQDGMYTWQYPQEKPSARGAHDTATHRAFFRIELPGLSPLLSTARNAFFKLLARDSLTDIVSNFVLDKIKAYVLKFVAPKVVGGAANFLGRNERYGFVDMSGNDSEKWTFKESLSDLELTEQNQRGPARILLFIHGTFSTTEGAFGALKILPWGQKFLKSARGEGKYDAVLGFNHPTLSSDPCANAEELLRQLRQLQDKWPDRAPQIDIITHSRGGLVTRSLIERLLPESESSWKPKVGSVIFVACTNRGTPLASLENWKKLADWYSNLVVAQCQLFKLMPYASLAVATEIVKEAVTGLSDFVKYAATYTLTEDGVPGLAAMNPDGTFITEINKSRPNQPTKEQTFYCAITSKFKAGLFGGGLNELPKRLGQMVWAGFVKRLMKGESHDLVVNTASMKAIDRGYENFIKDSLDFTVGSHLHHLNYFTQPKVINALARWFRLEELNNGPCRSQLQALIKGPSPDKPARIFPPEGYLGLGNPEQTQKDIQAHKVFGVEIIESWSPFIPAVVDANFIPLDIPLDADAKTLADVLHKMLREKPQAQACNFIVIRRMREKEELYYAFKLSPEIHTDCQKLIDALNKHPKMLPFDDLIKKLPFTGSSQTNKRHWWERLIRVLGFKRPSMNDSMATVVTHDGKPVGILPESIEPLSSKQLEELAKFWVQHG